MLDADFLEKALSAGAAIPDIRTSPGIRPHWMRPEGYEVVSASDELLQEPWRLKQIVTVFDPKSFTDYFTDYCNLDSRVFVDSQAPTIVGVLDYHRQPAGDAKEPAPDWGQHRLIYKFRPTKEWTTWTASDRKPVKQVEFARFVEENLVDIFSPAHADMLQISRAMEAKKNVNFSSGVRLQNGEVQLTYQEEIRGTAASGTIEIPEFFTIKIAPFEGSDLYTVDCRFRYQIIENSLQLRYEMVRPHKIIEHAVTAVAEKIRQGLTNPITYGVI